MSDEPDSAEPLLARMQEVAKAVGQIVSVGCYAHRDDWFAHCDGVEWQSSTPLDALESVVQDLVKHADTEAATARGAIAKASRLREVAS